MALYSIILDTGGHDFFLGVFTTMEKAISVVIGDIITEKRKPIFDGPDEYSFENSVREWMDSKNTETTQSICSVLRSLYGFNIREILPDKFDPLNSHWWKHY